MKCIFERDNKIEFQFFRTIYRAVQYWGLAYFVSETKTN